VLLCRTTDPEAKRNIIGDTFMTVANRVIAEMNLDPGKVSPLDIFTGNIDYFSTIEQIYALISSETRPAYMSMKENVDVEKYLFSFIQIQIEIQSYSSTFKIMLSTVKSWTRIIESGYI
jgi:hypothetical protein